MVLLKDRASLRGTKLTDKELKKKLEGLIGSFDKEGNEPFSKICLNAYKKATPAKRVILIYSIVSLLIFLFFTWGAVSEKNIFVIFIAVPFIAIQWGIYYLTKWSIRYLKKKSPTDWRAVLSVWIACVVFLMLSLFCFTGAGDEGYISAQFFIGSISIAAVLATVLFSIKKIQKQTTLAQTTETKDDDDNNPNNEQKQ